MHISEGILPGPVLAAGALMAAAGVAAGLRRMDMERTPRAAMLSSVLFVASTIHIPFGPASVHLVFNGIAGILLGWMVFPALFVALLLQAVLFQFGGLTTLGVNLLNMALPGVAVHYVFRLIQPWIRRPDMLLLGGALLGSGSILLSAVMLACFLASRGDVFLRVGMALAAAHIPVMIADGCITGTALVLIRNMRPDLLVFPHRGAP